MEGEGEEEMDTHICLSCQMPILGLDNYIYHKKFSCPAKKSPKPRTALDGSHVQVQRNEFVSHSQPSLTLGEGLMTSQSMSVGQPNQHELSVLVGNHGVLPGTSVSNITGDTVTYSGTPSRFSAVDPNMVLCSRSNSEDTLTSPPPAIPSLASTDGLTEVTLSQQHSPTQLPGGTPSIIDFLSSLELQCRSTPAPEKSIPSTDRMEGLEDRNLGNRVPEGLKFASLLNELTFDSDSEGFDMPSDAEDLLNFDEEDYQALNQSYSGKDVKGKVRMMGKTESAKGGKKGRMSYVGKWKPGDRPQTGGKGMSLRPVSIGKRHYEDPSSDEEQEEADQTETREAQGATEPQDISANGQEPLETQEPEAKRARKIETDPEGTIADDHTYVGDDKNTTKQSLKCDPCDKIFSSRHALHNHVRSAQHCHLASLSEDQRVLFRKNSSKPEITECKTNYSGECSSCMKTFNNKYNHARHLLSSLHARRSKSSVLTLDAKFQRLLLRLKRFQCRICEFFCNSHEDLLQHLSSEQHRTQAQMLVGPMCCVPCKFTSPNYEEMYNHFTSESHKKCIEVSDRPCVLKEVRGNLTCHICKKHVHSATALKKHLSARHKESSADGGSVRKTSVCPMCDKNCKTKHNMQVHMRRHHTREKPYSCDTCKKRFMEQSTLNMHYKSQKHLDNVIAASAATSPIKKEKSTDCITRNSSKSKMFKCKYCDFFTPDYLELRPHFIKAHNKMHMCEVCGFSFMSDMLLTKHLETEKHKKMEQEAEAAGNVALSCSHCRHKFYCKEKLSLHMLSHSAKPRNRKGNQLLGVPEKFHKFVLSLPKKNNKVDIQCPECNVTLKHSNIVIHLRSHGDPVDQPYKCKLCTKTFTSNSTLYRHHKSHLGIKPFECNICFKKFRSGPQMESHQLKAHRTQTEIKPRHQCSVCGMEFVQANRFKIHMKYHESEKQFKCTALGCKRSFVLLSSLKDHERVHSGERPFLCDLCGFATKTNTHMTRHKRVHTGETNYECQYCTFKASHSWGLRRHMRIHIGCKPYKCPYCDYRCNCHTNLRHHVLSSKRHAGMPVYKCKFCDMGTNHAKEYQKHMIDVHQVPEEEVENICVYAGIYIKESDTRTIPEGSQVHPVREKKPKLKKERPPPKPPARRPLTVREILPEPEVEEAKSHLLPVPVLEQMQMQMQMPMHPTTTMYYVPPPNEDTCINPELLQATEPQGYLVYEVQDYRTVGLPGTTQMAKPQLDHFDNTDIPDDINCYMMKDNGQLR